MKPTNRNIESNPLLIKWVVYVREAAIKVSLYLQEKSERFSYTIKRAWLIVFCVFGIACSLSVIAYSFVNSDSPLPNRAIRLPAQVSDFSSLPVSTDSLITSLEYHRIKQFKDYLMRQQHDVYGRLFYDSLLKARPHLIDSLRIIDSLFLSQ